VKKKMLYPHVLTFKYLLDLPGVPISNLHCESFEYFNCKLCVQFYDKTEVMYDHQLHKAVASIFKK
jgi:hypothetical protein